MCMYDAGEGGWVFVHETTPKARKEHTCCECGRTIAKGETYRYISGKSYDADYIDTFKMCRHCETAARWLVAACEGYCLAAVQEDLGEHVTGDESYLRSRPLTRLYRWMLADWRNRAGELRPAEDVKVLADEAIAAYRAQYTKAVRVDG